MSYQPVHQSSSSVLNDADIEEIESISVPSGTITSSTINLANTILGTGMLAMVLSHLRKPLALANVGLALGVLMIGFAAAASIFGLVLLSRCASELSSRNTSFFAVASAVLPKAAVAIDAAIAIKCFGVSISYLVVVGDLMPIVVKYFVVEPSAFWISKVTWITFGMLVIGPVSYSREFNALKYTSAIALMSVVYLLAVVIGYAIAIAAGINIPGMPQKFISPDEIIWFKFSPKIFTTLPIFVFAFTCHQNIFAVHNELVDTTKTPYVAYLSIGAAFVVYQLIGTIGFISFGYYVGSNLITMYPKSPVIVGGQFAIAVLVLLSYPLQLHPCRASFEKVYMNGSLYAFDRRRFRIITTSIIAASYLLSITVKDLSTVLSLVGATGSTTICYILPGLLYHKMAENRTEDTIYKKLARPLAIFGVCVMVISVVSLIA